MRLVTGALRFPFRRFALWLSFELGAGQTHSVVQLLLEQWP